MSVSLVLEVILERRILPVDSQYVSHAVGLEALLVFRRLLQIKKKSNIKSGGLQQPGQEYTHNHYFVYK